MIEIKILNEPLDYAACIHRASDETCGGMVVFTGLVRSTTKGRKVVRLEYECYESMALKELRKIGDYIVRSWTVKNIVIHHRVGVLNITDTAVIVAVSAPHREAAFEACQYAIDTLKQTVPIWKKEVFADGEEWVSAHA